MTDTTPTTKRVNLTEINPLLRSNPADTFDAAADALAAITEFFADGAKDFPSDRVCFGMAHLLGAVEAACRFSSEHGKLLADGGGLDVPIVGPRGQSPDSRLGVTGVHTEVPPDAARVARDWAELSPAGRATILDEIRVLAAAEAAVAD